MTPHTVDIKVRFSDVDFAQIVYYPRFYHYFHVAFEELFERRLGLRYSQIMMDQHVGYPSVHTECDYRAPLHFGDVLRVEVTCARLGTKSVTLRYRGHRARDGVLSVEGLVTTACVDMRTFTSRDVPPAHRKMFEGFLDPVR